jgi:hypothetical protein
VSRRPYRIEICPTCGVGFKAGQEGNGKRCPAGHWHPMADLRKSAIKPKKQDQALRAMREEGIARDEHDATRIALASMIAGYDKSLETLPDGSLARRMVEGAFGNSIVIARSLMGV